ncbi:MAG: hypothetical protein U0529_02320 [Thermoanaerobaculia bacterium]
MKRSARPTRSAKRAHAILIPGFAGFDALGQIEYYANVTSRFQAFVERAGRRDAGFTLHYFDNLPTASVETRAERLSAYLAKRVARGEFQENDEVALVGHSTGGLDIRKLVWALLRAPTHRFAVDALSQRGMPHAARVSRLIKRVVFLSVPHRGTRIADWVRRHVLGRKVVVDALRAMVGAAQARRLGDLEERAARALSGRLRADLLCAVEDALHEAQARHFRTRPDKAAAQAAAAELALWLRHIGTDFDVIDDLTWRPRSTSSSPAHFGESDRRREKDLWERHGIEAASYATISPRPACLPPPDEAWDPLDPRVLRSCTGRNGLDAPFCTCYAACERRPGAARLPRDAVELGTLHFLSPAHEARIRSWMPRDRIDSSHSDGIVNTVSMLSPPAGGVTLVAADHMDIVGHFARVPHARRTSGRHQSYDLLASRSGFGAAAFREVWDEIFSFCFCG